MKFLYHIIKFIPLRVVQIGMLGIPFSPSSIQEDIVYGKNDYKEFSYINFFYPLFFLFDNYPHLSPEPINLTL